MPLPGISSANLTSQLGTTGSEIQDSAISVLGAIGVNSANNAFDSSLVAANVDGSALERLEALQQAVGTDDANNAQATTNVVSNVDGSIVERLESIQQGLPLGQEFWLKKTLTSSAITQAGVAVTGASSGGELAIEDVILQTDATGLAAMTNFTLTTDNAKGLPTFLSTAASGLGANKTIEMSAASVSKTKMVLESGKIVTAKATAADGTGAGTIDVWIKFRRLAQGATIAAA